MGGVIKAKDRYTFLEVSKELALEIVTNEEIDIEVYGILDDDTEYLIEDAEDINSNDRLGIELGFSGEAANYWHLLTLATGLALIAEKNYERKGENL